MTEANSIRFYDGVSGPAGQNPEFGLAMRYVSFDALPSLVALFALDSAIAGILRTTREPMVGQMRLTWWHEALTRLDSAPPPAEPVLQALAQDVVPLGISGARLAGMIEGWEEILDGETLVDAAITGHADARGGALFAMAGEMLGARDTDPVVQAGRGWALADLGRHLSDQAIAERVLGLAAAPLTEAGQVRWSRAARPLGALAQIARMNLAVPLDRPLPIGAPRRVGRLLLHRLWGR
ncbi:MAG: squalene/phytoene synthase family protein [Sphingomonas sp.]